MFTFDDLIRKTLTADECDTIAGVMRECNVPPEIAAIVNTEATKKGFRTIYERRGRKTYCVLSVTSISTFLDNNNTRLFLGCAHLDQRDSLNRPFGQKVALQHAARDLAYHAMRAHGVKKKNGAIPRVRLTSKGTVKKKKFDLLEARLVSPKDANELQTEGK